MPFLIDLRKHVTNPELYNRLVSQIPIICDWAQAQNFTIKHQPGLQLGIWDLNEIAGNPDIFGEKVKKGGEGCIAFGNFR